MTNKTMTTWEPVCDVEFRGLQIENNWTSEVAMIKNIRLNRNTDILFISSNDGATPTSFQGYNLDEVIKIRDYLNNLINIAENALA